MRLSVQRDDPGYSDLATCSIWTVLLNGYQVGGWIITADEEKGEIIRYVVGPDGQPIYDYSVPDDITCKREILWGKVEILDGRELMPT